MKALFLTYTDAPTGSACLAENNAVYADANLFTFFQLSAHSRQRPAVLKERTIVLSIMNAKAASKMITGKNVGCLNSTTR